MSDAFNFSHVEAIVGVEAVFKAEIAESERTVAIALKMAWSASTSSLLRLLKKSSEFEIRDAPSNAESNRRMKLRSDNSTAAAVGGEEEEEEGEDDVDNIELPLPALFGAEVLRHSRAKTGKRAKHEKVGCALNISFANLSSPTAAMALELPNEDHIVNARIIN